MSYADFIAPRKPYHYREMGTFNRILDFIQRPQFTIANVLKEVQTPEKRTWDEILAPIHHVRLPEEVKGSTRELVENTSMPSWAKTAIGVGGNIATDPLTYVGGPLIKGALKGVALGSEAAGLTPKILEAIEPIAKQFRYGSKVKPLQEALETANRGGRTLMAEAAARTGKFGQEVAESGLKNPDVTAILEAKGAVHPLKESYQTIEKWWQKLEQDVGLGTASLDDTVDYVMASTTGKGGRSLGRALRAANSGLQITDKEKALLEAYYGAALDATPIAKNRWLPRMAPAHTSMFARRITGMDTAAKNAISQSLGFGKMWVDNPVLQTTKRSAMAIKAWRKATFLGSAADKLEEAGLAVRGAEVPEGWKGIDESVLKWIRKDSELYGKLADLKFSPQIRDEMVRVFNAYVSPKAPSEFGRLYGQALSTLKWFTLQPFPTYHARNIFANDAWTYYLAEGVNYAPFARAARILKIGAAEGQYGNEAVARGALTYLPGGRWAGKTLEAVGLKHAASPYTDEQVYKMLVEHGIVGTGMFRGEAGLLPRMYAAKGLGGAMKAAESVTAASEDLARAALFEASLAKGMAPEQAAARVFRYYYKFGQDFGGPADKALGNIFFFWRWMSQNMVGSTKNFVDHFGKVSAMAKVVKAVEDRVGMGGEEMAPEWLKERGGIKIMKGKKGPQYLTLQGWLPMADLGQVTRPLQYALESLVPFARVPLELAAGREFYYDRPIKEYPGQRRDLAGQVPIDPYVEYFSRQLRVLSEPARLAKRMAQVEGTPLEKAAQMGLQLTAGARAYPVDTQREAATRFFDEIAQMARIKKDIKTATAKGRTGEVQRLMRLLQQMTGKSERYRQVAGIQ